MYQRWDQDGKFPQRRDREEGSEKLLPFKTPRKDEELKPFSTRRDHGASRGSKNSCRNEEDFNRQQRYRDQFLEPRVMAAAMWQSGVAQPGQAFAPSGRGGAVMTAIYSGKSKGSKGNYGNAGISQVAESSSARCTEVQGRHHAETATQTLEMRESKDQGVGTRDNDQDDTPSVFYYEQQKEEAVSEGDIPTLVELVSAHWHTQRYAVRAGKVLEILDRLGCATPVCDAFSDGINRRFSTWWGPTSRTATDAWKEDWGKAGLLWANPPYDKLNETVEKIIEDAAEVVFIAPDWWNQPWFRRVWPICKAHVFFPPGTRVFELVDDEEQPGHVMPGTRWGVWAFWLKGNKTTKAFRRRERQRNKKSSQEK